jgi:hypothetical protein
MVNGENFKITAPPEVMMAIRSGELPMFLSNDKGPIELNATKCARFLISRCQPHEDPLQLLRIFGHLPEVTVRKILSDSKLNDLILSTASELGDTYPHLEQWGLSILQAEFQDLLDRGWALASIDNAFGGESHIVGYSSSSEDVTSRLESIRRFLTYIRTHKQRKPAVDLTTGPDLAASVGGKARQESSQGPNQWTGGNSFKHDEISLDDSKSLLCSSKQGKFVNLSPESHIVLTKLASKFKSNHGHGQVETRAILGSMTTLVRRGRGYRVEMTTRAATVTGHLSKQTVGELMIPAEIGRAHV